MDRSTGEAAGIGATGAVEPHAPERFELVREALTMAFYVAICVFAALEAVSGDARDGWPLVGLVWGTTLGLAAAHWFAFRLSTRAVASGRWTHDDALLGAAQLLGAAGVAVVVTIPVVVLPHDDELVAARVVIGAFIGVSGFFVARRAGATRARAVAYAGVVVIIGCAIAVAKNLLAGH